jgi:uncharacterized membrane protein YhaH (DUF805 family)
MWNRIVTYGALSGLIVATPMVAASFFRPEGENSYGNLLIGYATMIVALSLVFVAVKRRRDIDLGGTIRFLPALGMGLAISLVAGVIYVLGWEVALLVSDFDYIEAYSAAAIDAQKAKGLSGAELDAFVARMDQMKQMYANL